MVKEIFVACSWSYFALSVIAHSDIDKAGSLVNSIIIYLTPCFITGLSYYPGAIIYALFSHAVPGIFLISTAAGVSFYEHQ
jgi:hypothetical protein